MLVGVATEGRRPPCAGCAISIDGRPVGEVTSGNYSPILEHGIALGFVDHDAVGADRVSVDVRGTALDGRIVATPFVTKR